MSRVLTNIVSFSYIDIYLTVRNCYTEEVSKIFGERLKKLRTQKELLQSDLATEFNVSRVTITNWENGRQEPSMDAICTIADFFDVTADYLIGRERDEGAATLSDRIVG